ncbi:MAG: flagellar basal body P-ring formation chaperone FlgA [Vicinamibacterales bacterium]
MHRGARLLSLLGVVVLTSWSVAGAAQAPGDTAPASAETAAVVTPEQAILRAIERRLGVEGSASLDNLSTTVRAMPGLSALLDPAARLGRPARFTLVAGGRRQGVAIATVRARVRHARTVRAIDRGDAIAADDLEIVEADPGTLPFRRLPDPASVAGLVARRPILTGEVITSAVVDLPLLVRVGDEVEMLATVGVVEVRDTAIATGSGHHGDVIRVRPHQRPLVKGRVIGPGLVEVVR